MRQIITLVMCITLYSSVFSQVDTFSLSAIDSISENRHRYADLMKLKHKNKRTGQILLLSGSPILATGVVSGLIYIFDYNADSRFLGMNSRTAFQVFFSTGVALVFTAIPFMIKSNLYGRKAYKIFPKLSRHRAMFVKPDYGIEIVQLAGRNIPLQAMSLVLNF